MTSGRKQRTVDHKIFHDLEDFRHLIVDVVAVRCRDTFSGNYSSAVYRAGQAGTGGTPEMKTPYDDIIHLPHHVSRNHPQMPMLDRAAQFAPFAALTGYEAAVGETARLTAERRELDAQEAEELNRRLAALIANLPDRPEATIEYFVPDDRKSGGAYVTVTGRVRHISVPEKTLVMEDGTVIGFEDIAAISGFQFEI